MSGGCLLYTSNRSKQKQDNKTIKEIKNKVKNNNLIITKADKSQATVTLIKQTTLKKPKTSSTIIIAYN